MVELREEVALMQAYPYPKKDFADVKLDQNESGYDVPDGLKEKLADSLGRLQLNRYPDSSYLKLRELIAKKEGCKPENVIVGNGGDEILQMIALAYLSPKIGAITLVPTFSVYKMVCQMQGCRLEEAQFADGFAVPDDFAEKVKGKAAFLCNPNNPTGTVIGREMIEKIAKNAELVVLDEAYSEFMGWTYPITQNIISVRTLSKAFCAAGVRLGFAIAPENLIADMERVRMPWNIGALPQKMAELLLENPEWFEGKVKETIAERGRVADALSKYATTYQSGGNFIFAKSDRINYGRLIALGIKVRCWKNLPDCFRVTIGTEEENGIFLSAVDLICRGTDKIIFDMDGTLVDVSKSYRAAIMQSVKEFSGKNIGQNDIDSLKAIPGFNNDWDVSYALAFGLDNPDAVERNSPDYKKIKEIFQLAYLGKDGKGGLRELEAPLISCEDLLELSKKYKLAIATSRPRAEALWAVEKFFAGAFKPEMIVGMEDCDEEKPSPKPLLKAASLAGAKNAIYIGDSGSDAAAAGLAKMPFVFVGKERRGEKLWLRNPADLRKVLL